MIRIAFRLTGRPPNHFHYPVEVGVMFLEFSAHERVEVITVEISFSALGKVFLVVGHGVVPDILPGKKHDPVITSCILGFFVCSDDCRMLKGEELVMVCVGEFVQHDCRVLEQLSPGKQGFCLGDVDFFDEPGVMAL